LASRYLREKPMTVPASTPITSYTGNGVTTIFAFGFKILQASDLRVLVNGAVVTNYTVAGVGSPTGGSITFTVAPANLATIILRRAMPIARGTDFQTLGALAANTLNDDQDSPVMMAQQLSEQLNRLITAPESDIALTQLPAAAARANLLLSFDSNGQPTVVAPVAGSASALATQLASSAGAAGVGFIQSGAGAVARTVQAKLRDVVSVLDFGAVGDGVADDTTKIQAALTAAAGKALYFPASSSFYAVIDELTIPTGTTVFGDGWGSKIKQTAANKNLFVAGKFCVIDGLHLIGRGTGATDFTKNSGVFADLVGNFKVQNCFIEQFEGSGIEVRRCRDYSITNNFLFANIWSTYLAGVPGASTADILLYSAQANSSRIIISGNFCLSNNSQGIYADALGGNGDVIIANNVCVTLDASTCTEGGAWTEFTFTTNASALHRRHGIVIGYSNQSQNGPRAVIHGNVCRNTGWTGIYKDGISQGPVLITANVCTNNGYGVSNPLSGGIWIYADGNERVENNYVGGFKNTDTSGSGGISIYATTAPTKRTVVANNTIRDSANCGVWIGTQAAMIDLIGNTLVDIVRDGILWIPSTGVAGVGGHRIIGNRIARNSVTVRPAIYLQPYASTLTIVVENNDLIGSDNTTVNAVNCGIYFTGSTCRLAQIVNNRFDNFYYGYYNDSAWTGRDFDALLERNIVSNCNTGLIIRANNNNVTVPLVDNIFISTPNRFGADGFSDAARVCERVGTRLYWESTAVPSVGSWAVGDRSVNRTPASGQPKAWACTVAGTPGTWVSEGNL
jgi:hypothetical protein